MSKQKTDNGSTRIGMLRCQGSLRLSTRTRDLTGAMRLNFWQALVWPICWTRRKTTPIPTVPLFLYSFILLMIDGRNERGGGTTKPLRDLCQEAHNDERDRRKVSNPRFKSTFESAKSIATRTTTIAQRIAQQTYHRSKTRQKTLGWGIDIKFTKKCRRIPCGKTEKENRLQRRQNLFA